MIVAQPGTTLKTGCPNEMHTPVATVYALGENDSASSCFKLTWACASCPCPRTQQQTRKSCIQVIARACVRLSPAAACTHPAVRNTSPSVFQYSH